MIEYISRKLSFFSLAFASLLLVSACAQTEPEKTVQTKNVILMIPDGNSTSLLALARWYKQYQGEEPVLAVDEGMCGLVRSFLTDSPICASSGAMSAYMTGYRTTANMMSTYPAVHPGHDMEEVDTARAYQPLFTVLEAAKTGLGKATGLVFTVEFPHATPGATSAHSTNRTDYASMSLQMLSFPHDVVIGGGTDLMSPEHRKILDDKGVNYIEDYQALRAYDDASTPVWALLHSGHLPYEIDRERDDEPRLSEMTRKAIDLLSKKENGFFLMVEGSIIDYAAHANDPVTCILEYLEFDRSVQIALDFAKKDGNTTVVVLPDHGCAGINLGGDDYHGYYRKGLTSAFNGTDGVKCSAEVLARKIREAGPEHAAELFQEWVGMTITPQEQEVIAAHLDKKVRNHMEVSGSLQSEVQKIMKKRMNFSYVSGNHTIEDVFLSIYSPSGDRLEGVKTNTELNEYLCKVTGLTQTLDEYTDKYFCKASEVFEGMEMSEDSESFGYPVLTVRNAGKTLEVHANRSFVMLDGKRIELKVASIYMLENSTFYVCRDLADMIR